jgi:3-phosphoshikimate 1-carboxyvinyltransferase
LAGELATCGADVVVEADGLVITPATLNGGDVHPHDDHRLAMSLALLGLAGPAVRVHDAEVVTKSWPKYWSAMRSAMAR